MVPALVAVVAIAAATVSATTTLTSFATSCDAKFALSRCILSSPSRSYSTRPASIQACVAHFITAECPKSKGPTCQSQASVDAMLLYHYTLANTADMTWSWHQAMGAVTSTMTHANCIVEVFMTTMVTDAATHPGCATKTTQVATSSLRSTMFGQLTGYLSAHRSKAIRDKSTSSSYIAPPSLQITTTSSNLPRFGRDDEGSPLLVSTVDAKWHRTTVTACSYPAPSMTVDPIHGTDVESLAFHLPVLDTTNDHDDDSIRFHSAFRHTTHEGPHSLQATCAKYFVDTQAAFDHSVHDLSMWSFAPDKGGEGVALRWNAETKRVECYRDGKTTTRCTLLRSRDAVSMLPSGPSSMYPSCPILEGHRNASSLCQLGQTWRHLKNAGDKCFSYSGYHRLVVTNPHDVHNNITAPPAALHLESVPGRPFCKFASWSNDEATCHAKRTQWYMTLGCCKSYGTIVADERAKGHPLPDRGDVGALVYEKTFAALDKSDSRVGARPPRLVAAPWDDRDSTSTTDDPSLLHTLMQQWVPYCTQQKRGSSRTVAPPDETDMDETEVMWCRRVREWHVATCFLNPFAPVWCKLSLQSSSSSSLWTSGGGDSGGEGGVVVVVNTQCQANTSTGVFRVDTAVDDVALACLNLPPSSEPFGVAFAHLHVTPKPTWTEPRLALIGFAAGAMTMWIIVVWIWPVDEKKTVRRRRRQAEGDSSDEYCLDMVLL